VKIQAGAFLFGALSLRGGVFTTKQSIKKRDCFNQKAGFAMTKLF